jgi:hypothetical protein
MVPLSLMTEEFALPPCWYCYARQYEDAEISNNTMIGLTVDQSTDRQCGVAERGVGVEQVTADPGRCRRSEIWSRFLWGRCFFLHWLKQGRQEEHYQTHAGRFAHNATARMGQSYISRQWRLVTKCQVCHHCSKKNKIKFTNHDCNTIKCKYEGFQHHWNRYNYYEYLNNFKNTFILIGLLIFRKILIKAYLWILIWVYMQYNGAW